MEPVALDRPNIRGLPIEITPSLNIGPHRRCNAFSSTRSSWSSDHSRPLDTIAVATSRNFAVSTLRLSSRRFQ